MKSVHIYCLSDPLDKRIKYIGQSNNINSRLSYHVSESRRQGSKKSKWIFSLIKKGFKPNISILETVPLELGNKTEQKWFEFFKCSGIKLVNDTSFRPRPLSKQNCHRKRIKKRYINEWYRLMKNGDLIKLSNLLNLTIDEMKNSMQRELFTEDHFNKINKFFKIKSL